MIAIAAFFLATLVGPGRAEEPVTHRDNWPHWRGPLQTGESPTADPPIAWSESTNVRYKVPLPGLGKSTPVVWGDLVFVTASMPIDRTLPENERPVPAADPDGQHPGVAHPDRFFAFDVIALHRESGETVWRRRAREAFPHEGTHRDGTFASGSAVTDGEHLYAFFGSRGLYCFDFEGNLVWERDLGDLVIRRGFGEGSSPVLHDDKIIVLWDHEGPSFIVALDKRTGQDVWRVERDEITSWGTPFVALGAEGAQVVTNGTGRVRSYDAASGALVWEASGTTLNAIPSPVGAGGMVFVTSGFRGSNLKAVRLDAARGDVTGTEALAWTLARDTPYVPSPLLYRDTLYVLKSNSGILNAFDAASGEKRYGPVRLEGVMNVYASPVAAAGRIYVAGRDGNTIVFEAGAEPSVLSLNSLEDGFDASPAIVGEDLFLRGRGFLYRIAEPEP